MGGGALMEMLAHFLRGGGSAARLRRPATLCATRPRKGSASFFPADEWEQGSADCAQRLWKEGRKEGIHFGLARKEERRGRRGSPPPPRPFLASAAAASACVAPAPLGGRAPAIARAPRSLPAPRPTRPRVMMSTRARMMKWTRGRSKRRIPRADWAAGLGRRTGYDTVYFIDVCI